MSNKFRIGTRDSKLAMWQATQVKRVLDEKGHSCELVPVKTRADIDLDTPLHQFGGTGVFTKLLDDSLLNGDIDMAVHSLKDYPTVAPEGITIAAVLQRGNPYDILVFKDQDPFQDPNSKATIATGSIRRAAQWKHRYRNHICTGLRGNVQTRLQKLQDNDWAGAIFAKAGLERVDLLPENHFLLDWMIPAPAQGIIGIGCLKKNADVMGLLKSITHEETARLAAVERQFLNTAEGGCSAPIGAFAIVKDKKILLQAGIFHPSGRSSVIVEESAPIDEFQNLGERAALKALKDGGREIMKEIIGDA